MDNDEVGVGNDFYDFLQLFFNKNPDLRNKKFYITGESYAGHYVPAIAHKIWTENKKIEGGLRNNNHINLAGIGIGNGLVDAQIQYPYYPDMAISTNHHAPAVNSFVYKLMKAAVYPCVALIEQCQKSGFQPACVGAVEACNLGLMGPYQASGLNPYDMRLKCQVPPLCNDYKNLEKYLNNETVKSMLHIPVEKKWQTCNQEVNLMFTTHGDGIQSVTDLVADVLQDIHVVVYAGDQDYICNWIGNQAWVDQLDWPHQEEFAKLALKPWLVNGKEAGQSKSAHGLTFIRVYDAGHMVPQDQPEAGIKVLNEVLQKRSDTVRLFSDVLNSLIEK